jgi:Zn-dependent protease
LRPWARKRPTPFLPFSRVSRNLVPLPDIDLVGVLLAFIVLLFSLTVHESAHAWTADVLGDPTARQLGRVSLNPLVHIDPFGTVLFPLIAIVTGAPLIGWAKPTPVSVGRLRHPRRDYMLVAAAGPISNLALAFLAAVLALVLPARGPIASAFREAMEINVWLAVFNLMPIPPLDGGNILAGLLPRPLRLGFDRVRPYGFVILYALMLSGGLERVVVPPYNLVRALLP